MTATLTTTVLLYPLASVSTSDQCMVAIRWITSDGQLLLPEGGILGYGFETAERAAEFAAQAGAGLVWANPQVIVDRDGDLAVRADIIC